MAYSIYEHERKGRATWWHVVSEDGEIISRHRTRHAAATVVKADDYLRQRLSGKRICVQSPLSMDGEPARAYSYFIEPGGSKLNRSDFDDLKARGLLRPVGDALFPGMTQTYEIAE